MIFEEPMWISAVLTIVLFKFLSVIYFPEFEKGVIVSAILLVIAVTIRIGFILYDKIIFGGGNIDRK